MTTAAPRWWLSGRAVAALAVAGLALVAAVVVVPLQIGTADLRESARQRVRSTASVAAFAVQQRMSSLGGLVGAFADDEQLVRALSAPPPVGRREAPRDPRLAEVQRLVGRIQATNPQIRTAAVFDGSGTLLAVSPPVPSLIGRSFAFRDYFSGTIAASGPYVSRAYVSTLPGRPLLTNAAVAVRPSGAPPGVPPLGVLTVAYDVGNQLQPWVDALATTDGVGLTVTDQAGQVVAAPQSPTDPPAYTGDALRRLDEPGVRSALAGKAALARVMRGGALQASAYAPVPGLGWTVSTAAPAAQVDGAAGRLRVAVLGIATVLGAILLLCVLGLARSVRGQARVRDDLAAAAAQASAALRSEQAAAERLRDVDQSKDRFLSSVSHELRTPLTNMIGYAELMSDGTLDPLTDQQRGAVATILRNGQRLLRLVEDLMAYTQLAGGRAELVVDAVPVLRLLETAAAATGPAAQARMHQVAVDVAPGTPAVSGDVVHLTRLVENLLDNAVKFTPPGGHIAVRAEPAGAGGRAGVRLTVTDDGPGIPQDEQARLFTRFHRSTSALRDAVMGTGLGLVHVAAVARAHGGDVTLRSDPGQGTTVTVDLPAHAAPAGGADMTTTTTTTTTTTGSAP